MPQHKGVGVGVSAAGGDIAFFESPLGRERKRPADVPRVSESHQTGPGRGAWLPCSTGISPFPLLRVPVVLFFMFFLETLTPRAVLGTEDVKVHLTPALPEWSFSR